MPDRHLTEIEQRALMLFCEGFPSAYKTIDTWCLLRENFPALANRYLWLAGKELNLPSDELHIIRGEN